MPEGLNWELFQGPAPRRPFKPGRLRWRAFYDYGGGLVSDWGVHLVDIAHLALKADLKAPLLTSAAAQYVNLDNPEKDQCPDAFSISWTYDNFVMSFTNAIVHDWEFGRQGTYFFGPNGSLLVHRSGFEVQPAAGAGRTRRHAATTEPAPGAAAAVPRELPERPRHDRPRPRLPRLRQVAEEAGRRHRDRLLLVAADAAGAARHPRGQDLQVRR